MDLNIPVTKMPFRSVPQDSDLDKSLLVAHTYAIGVGDRIRMILGQQETIHEWTRSSYTNECVALVGIFVYISKVKQAWKQKTSVFYSFRRSYHRQSLLVRVVAQRKHSVTLPGRWYSRHTSTGVTKPRPVIIPQLHDDPGHT